MGENKGNDGREASYRGVIGHMKGVVWWMWYFMEEGGRRGRGFQRRSLGLRRSLRGNDFQVHHSWRWQDRHEQGDVSGLWIDEEAEDEDSSEQEEKCFLRFCR